MMRFYILWIAAIFAALGACSSKNNLPGAEQPQGGNPLDTAVVEDAAITVKFLGLISDTLDVNPRSLPTISVEVRARKKLTAVTLLQCKDDNSTSLIKRVTAFDSLVYQVSLTAAEAGLNAYNVIGLRVTAEDEEENYAQRQLTYRFLDPNALAPTALFTNVNADTLKVNIDPNAAKPTPCFEVSGLVDTVRLYVLKNGGVVQQHGSTVTTFTAGQNYASCFENVSYTTDMVGLRVFASNKGKAAVLDLPLKVWLDPNAAPSVKFLTGNPLRVNTHVEATKPYVQLRVVSSVGLQKLVLWRVNNDTEIKIVELTTFANKHDFTKEVAELTPSMFSGLERIIVDAYDESGKFTKVTLPVETYSADPLLDDLSAFPGAEGFGKNATGGRGGAVYYVTSLADQASNPPVGTLRYAVNQSGARTIIFKVSGTIQLKNRLSITKGDLTIAGQTAPGDGVCLAGYDVTVDADNVVVRYLRFRMGAANGREADAFGARGKSNMIIDHCSMSWSVDECASFYEMHNFTMQWCLLSESLRNSLHGKGAHGYGAIWGGQNVTFHHNMLAHHDSRNPRFASGESGALPIDYRNNVVYNWGGNSAYGGEASNINIVNNYNKPGPATKSSDVKRKIYSPDKKLQDDGSDRFHGIIGKFGKFFVEGNYVYGSPESTNDNWGYGIQVPASYGATAQDKANMKAAVPFAYEPITQHGAEVAYERVLESVGASLKRDAIDTRVINECRTGTYTYKGSNGSTNGIIDNEQDVGGLPTLESLPAPLDSDSDGMPDAWEVANGLNPNSAGDGKEKALSGVYTNLEVYLSSIVLEITDRQRK